MAAAVERRRRGRCVLARREIQVRPVSLGLVRLHARAADPGREQAARRRACRRARTPRRAGTGPAARASGCTGRPGAMRTMADDACRYACVITIRFTTRLTSHPSSRNVTASQSSSSGCDGHAPCEPKSSTDVTNPWPNAIFQSRLTNTRATSGLSRPTSHRARSSRDRATILDLLAERRRDRRRDDLARVVEPVPARQDSHGPRRARRRDQCLGRRGEDARRARDSRSAMAFRVGSSAGAIER